MDKLNDHYNYKSFEGNVGKKKKRRAIMAEKKKSVGNLSGLGGVESQYLSKIKRRHYL